MKCRAVLFDLDGTLLDTIEDIKMTMNQALKKNGFETFSVQDYKQFVGKGVDLLIRKVMEVLAVDKSMFDVLKRDYFEIYKSQSKVNTKIYQGIKELLYELKKMGISVNVLSNKPHLQTIDVIDYYFESSVFDVVYGKKENYLPKPAPDLALNLIERINVLPEETIYVGDTSVDILTAKNAGFKSIGVLWGFRDRLELLEAKSDFIVDKPEQILEIIKSINLI